MITTLSLVLIFSGVRADSLEMLGLCDLPMDQLLLLKRNLDQTEQDCPVSNWTTPLAQSLTGHHPWSRGDSYDYDSGYGQSMKKGKGKGISGIFQMSITILSFLAFGGYLLCLIVQAVRAGVGTNTMATMAPNLIVLPPGKKRRRRELQDSEQLFNALLMLAEGYAKLQLNS